MRIPPPPTGPSPRIRLVGTGMAPSRVDAQAGPGPRDAVAVTDPRWILAAQAADRLGPGGMLTPEDRDTLNQRASRLGIAPFDAALIFAIVQDAGRRGQTGLSRATAERLAVVGGAKARPRSPVAGTTLWVLGLASVAFWAMVYWLTGAGPA